MKQIQTSQDETLKLMKEIILNTAKKHNIEIDKIILFGSRARGDYREDSDWDILIVTKKVVSREIADDFWLTLKRKLIENRIIPEIIIVSRDDFERYKELPGYIYHWAEKEGLLII